MGYFIEAKQELDQCMVDIKKNQNKIRNKLRSLQQKPAIQSDISSTYLRIQQTQVRGALHFLLYGCLFPNPFGAIAILNAYNSLFS